MALDAGKTLLRKENYNCPICEKGHLVEVYEEKTEALLKNKPVMYSEVFYFCPESKEEFFPEKVLEVLFLKL